VEFLKIDKSFVNDIDVSTESETIVRAISAMAASLGLKTIAEGVERGEQKFILSGIGCNMIQGYWYSKPLPYDLLLEFMKRFGKENSHSLHHPAIPPK
jgi:EAL domain-containing protein (putative c-di-GMP-specific phosphodiesterase class I)